MHRLILTLIALPCISPDLCVRLREARAAWLRRWEAVEVTRAATASASMDAAAAKACGGVSSGGVHDGPCNSLRLEDVQSREVYFRLLV